MIDIYMFSGLILISSGHPFLGLFVLIITGKLGFYFKGTK